MQTAKNVCDFCGRHTSARNPVREVTSTKDFGPTVRVRSCAECKAKRERVALVKVDNRSKSGCCGAPLSPYLSCDGGLQCKADNKPPIRTCKKCSCYTCTSGKCFETVTGGAA